MQLGCYDGQITFWEERLDGQVPAGAGASRSWAAPTSTGLCTGAPVQVVVKPQPWAHLPGPPPPTESRAEATGVVTRGGHAATE